MPIMLCSTPCCQYDISSDCIADVDIWKGALGWLLVGIAGGLIMGGGTGGGATGAVAMGGGTTGGTITGAPPMGVAGAPGFCMCRGGGLAGGLG